MTRKIFISDEDYVENVEDIVAIKKRLRDLIEKEKFLKVRMDDNFLLRYLRSSHFDPEMAVRKMQKYYTLKRQYPDWYITNESVASFKYELETHLYFLLEDRDRFGKRIYINKLGMIDTSKTTIQKQSQLQDLFLEIILDEEETQKNGVTIVLDLKNFSWALLKWLTPSNISTAVKKIEALPFKKLEFHVVNTSILLNTAIKLIWPFLSAKTKENIHFHYDDWSSLHKTIDPQFLPKQYGGTKAELDIEKLLRIVPGSENQLSGNLRLGYTQNPDD